jgi:hypothetical protein
MTADPLSTPRKMSVVDPDSRHPRQLDGRSVAEDLRILLQSPIRDTLKQFLFELANLELLAAAGQSADPTRERKSAEIPIPSFRSVWASRKRDQIDIRLWAESEALATFTARPYDPHLRGDLCPTCGHPPTREDICCRHCGRQLKQVDQIGEDHG